MPSTGREPPSRRLRRQRTLLLIPYTAAVVGLTMVVGYRPPTWPDGSAPLAASVPTTASAAEHGASHPPPSIEEPATGGAGTEASTPVPDEADVTPAADPPAAPPTSPPDGGGRSYAPTSTTAPAADASLDERDVRSVLGLVFDLGRPWAQKAPYIEAADALAAPYQQLVAATTAFGAVELRVADVEVQGDQAPFTVDAYLNGALVRPAIPGTAERVGPAWRLTRSSVCGALSVVAISCPA